jgi:hypothetical protein
LNNCSILALPHRAFSAAQTFHTVSEFLSVHNNLLRFSSVLIALSDAALGFCKSDRDFSVREFSNFLLAFSIHSFIRAVKLLGHHTHHFLENTLLSHLKNSSVVAAFTLAHPQYVWA